MANKRNETKFNHLKPAGPTKSITIPSTVAGSKLIVFVAGGAIATFRITDGSGTQFTRRNPYGGGAEDASWHEFVSLGGETVVHMTLNGAENVSGVIYEITDLGAYIGASSNETGDVPSASNNLQSRPTSSVTVSGKAVLFGGFTMPSTTSTTSTIRWRQFGPAGNLATFDANQPGQDTQFIWAAGYADIDQNHSYPENLPSGQYRATSQFIAAAGDSAFAAQVAYANSGADINTFSNAIVKENSMPGAHRSNWFLGSNGTNATIAGYTDKTSYSPGDTVSFKVDSSNNPFRVEIYRLGFYGNEQLGARNVLGVNTHITGAPEVQPSPSVDGTLGSTSCAWETTATWTIPNDTPPGLYYILFRRTDETANVASCHLTVKTDPTDKAVMITPDNTYQAYNMWGATNNNGSRDAGTWTGRNLYQAGADAGIPNFAHRSYATSFDRPYGTQSTRVNTYLFDSEFGMLVFAEAQGFDLTYASDIDLEKDSNYLDDAKLVMTNGHTEYWTTNMWDCYQNARDNGVNLMFNASNVALWRVRFDVGDINKRTMICYKDSATVDISAGFTGSGLDPVSYTGTWRDSRTSSPNNSDRRPEDSLTGQLFKVSAPLNGTLDVPFASQDLPIWRNSTSIQALTTGQTYTTSAGVVGDELDFVDDTSLTKPDNLVKLSPSTRTFNDQASNANGTIYTEDATNIVIGFSLYRADSGALVFNTGSWRGWLTVSRWQKGDYESGGTIDPNWQNAFLAIMHDLGVVLETPTTVRPADTQLIDPVTGAPGPTRDDIAVAYGLEVPVESGNTGNFIGFFF